MAHNDRENNRIHPGAYVRRHVIPERMTVTKAAKLLGVGRPALSNFLNGNADLSPEMALRLERTFGADRDMLMERQFQFDKSEDDVDVGSVTAGLYAPHLAPIRAIEIHDWAQRNSARRELPALVRRLVHTTGHDLTRVDFPAYDNAERKGWDGIIETSVPTPWIPEGKSGWELSCRGDIKGKAEIDYVKSLKAVQPKERQDTTFVFVTARTWKRKQDWAKEKTAAGHWKDVRVFDASDLEQWIEQSAAVQIWFAERLRRPVGGYRSIEQCWSDWTEDCEPPIWTALFAPSVSRFEKPFVDWHNEQLDRPFIVAADSRDEALAFLRCLARSAKIGIIGLDHRMIVFDTPAALERLKSVDRLPIVAIASTPEVERKIGFLRHRCHRVIIRSRNSVYGDPDIVLDRLHFLDFHKALESTGYAYERIERLARESGCSLTILRRRLSNIPEVQTPSWAGNAEIARKLIPSTLVGAWNSEAPGDRAAVLRLLRENDYARVEVHLAQLLDLEDPPLWSAGEYRGVFSRIDALFGIAMFVTKADIDHFFRIAEGVLSGRDPAIELETDQSRPAILDGTVRRHSEVLYHGIRETLVLLAIYGNRLFHRRLGFDVEARVADLVTKLLHQVDRGRILSRAQDLPDFAEAAPEVVLSLLENDIRKSESAICELMNPAGHSIFCPPQSTPLLWTLQVLAWNPRRFPRVVELLAKLCEMSAIGSDDNWSPSPRDTLASLFRSWMPQTAATLDIRLKALDALSRRHPSLGWFVRIGELDGCEIAVPNRRPRWRDDGVKTALEVPTTEQRRSIHECAKSLLDCDVRDEANLGDLVERLGRFNERQQLRIWEHIANWANSKPSDDEKASLRQRVRSSARMRHVREESIAHPDKEREVLKKLLPGNPILRHGWLFTTHWVDLPPRDAADSEYGDEDEQRLNELRIEALREIWEERGFQGVVGLLRGNETTSDLIGELMAGNLADRHDADEFFQSCLEAATSENSMALSSCLAGFIRKTDSGLLDEQISRTENLEKPDHFATLLLCMPFAASTWRRLDDKPPDVWDAYWKKIKPRTWKDSPAEETNESVDRLLVVGRPNAAFRAAYVAWNHVETSILKRLIYSLPAAFSDDSRDDPIIDNHHLSNAFDELDRRSGVTVEEKAQLEYIHLVRLDRTKHGIPNIEKHIAASPELFARVIACVYERADGGEDPPGFWSDNREQQLGIARRAHWLLNRIRYVPGTDKNGKINADYLKAWLEKLRSWCDRHDRTKICERKIGALLAHAPEASGVWPCRPVCEALESMDSDEIDESFVIGALSRRGVYMKGKGGGKEREHAEHYRTWSAELAEYPRVSRSLRRIATYYESEAGRQDTETEIMRRVYL